MKSMTYQSMMCSANLAVSHLLRPKIAVVAKDISYGHNSSGLNFWFGHDTAFCKCLYGFGVLAKNLFRSHTNISGLHDDVSNLDQI